MQNSFSILYQMIVAVTKNKLFCMQILQNNTIYYFLFIPTLTAIC